MGRGVLDGAFALIEELRGCGEAGLTRLADGAGLPRSAAHRLLDQLTGLGVVERRAMRYRLGPRLPQLAGGWQPGSTLRAAAREPMRRLAVALRESVGLVMPVNDQIIVVGAISGPADQEVAIRPGLVLPPRTAAELDLATGPSVGAAPDHYSALEWRRLTARARTEGLAFDRAEAHSSISCVASPVHLPTGEVVGAIVLEPGRLDPIADTVRRGARMVSANLVRIPSRPLWPESMVSI